MFENAAEVVTVIAQLLRSEQGAAVHVVSSLPATDDEGPSGLSLFPFLIGEPPHLGSTSFNPEHRGVAPGLLIHFLLLPSGASGEEAVRLLGEGMRALHEHPAIGGALLDGLRDAEGAERSQFRSHEIESIRITLSSKTPSEVLEGWGRGRRPALSSVYEVAVRLESKQ